LQQIGGFLRVLRFPPPIKLTATILKDITEILLKMALNILVSDRSVVFSGTTVFSNNETDHHDITEILLEVVFNTITSFFLLTFEDKTRSVF
jgi:hypothetical protein